MIIYPAGLNYFQGFFPFNTCYTYAKAKYMTDEHIEATKKAYNEKSLL